MMPHLLLAQSLQWMVVLPPPRFRLTENIMSEPYIVEDPARGLFQVNRRTFVEPQVLKEEKRFIFDRRGWDCGTQGTDRRAQG